jgi:lipopolysaccharide transport system permease protein
MRDLSGAPALSQDVPSFRPPGGFSIGVRDIAGALVHWRIWVMLGTTDVTRRYKRSRLGQFWLTGSMALMVAGMGVVYSGIFGYSVARYLPHIAVGFVLWTVLVGCVNEGCMAFLEAQAYVKQLNLPLSTFVARVVLRALFVMAHNAVIIPIVFLIYGVPVGWWTLAALPGLIVFAGNGAWMALVLATASTRFRDLPLATASFMQIGFFITPIMFIEEQLPPATHALLRWNPFASFIELVRAPLFGHPPSLHAVVISCTCLVFGWIFALQFFGKYRNRIVYWL